MSNDLINNPPGDALSNQIEATPSVLHASLPYYPYESLDIESSLRTFLNIILRQKLLIFLVTLLTAALCSLLIKEPQLEYTAKSTVRIKGYVPALDGPLETRLRKETEDRMYIPTAIALIKTRAVANRALADESVAKKIDNYLEASGGKQNSKEQSQALNKEQKIERYLDLISYEQKEKTGIVEITATTHNPELSALVSNAHSKAFSEIAHKERQGSALRVHEFLENRAENLKGEVIAIEKRVVSFAEKNNIFFNASGSERRRESDPHYRNNGDRDGNFSANRLEDLYIELTKAKVARTRAESLLRERRVAGSSKFPFIDPDSRSASKLFQELVKLEAEEDSFKNLNGVTRSHPYIKILKQQISFKRRAIQNLERSAVERLETEAKARAKQQKLLETEIEKVKDETLSKRDKASEFETMRNEYNSVRDTYGFILERLEEAKIAIASENKNVSIIDQALQRTIADNESAQTYHSFAGFFFGPLLGIALALLIHLFDNTIRTNDDLKRSIQVPSLGIIPSFTSKVEISIANPMQIEPPLAKNASPYAETQKNESLSESDVQSPIDFSASTTAVLSADNTPATAQHTGEQGHNRFQERETVVENIGENTRLSSQETLLFDTQTLIAAGAPWSVESEAFRNVRTTLSYSSADNPPKVILVTSSAKGDGKSTVTANLAVSLSQNANRVLLIDADLRRPSIHRMFNVPRTMPGLADYLAGQRDFSEVMLTNLVENLTVIVAGTPPPNPTELLGSRRMSDFLDMMAAEFDYVLIDTPPVLALSDARVLSRYVDGVVLVMRSGKTTKPMAVKATQELRQIGARILGTVLNGVEISKYSDYDPNDMYYYVEPEVRA